MAFAVKSADGRYLKRRGGGAPGRSWRKLAESEFGMYRRLLVDSLGEATIWARASDAKNAIHAAVLENKKLGKAGLEPVEVELREV
jgi:hypothetical protein